MPVIITRIVVMPVVVRAIIVPVVVGAIIVIPPIVMVTAAVVVSAIPDACYIRPCGSGISQSERRASGSGMRVSGHARHEGSQYESEGHDNQLFHNSFSVKCSFQADTTIA
jgi:hypothetical protein